MKPIGLTEALDLARKLKILVFMKPEPLLTKAQANKIYEKEYGLALFPARKWKPNWHLFKDR